MDPIPPEVFLEGYPPGVRSAAERLCAVVREAVPDAIERVHPGWRLIGFEYGAWMSDQDGLLRGAHLSLRKVRVVTYEPGDPIP